MRCVKQYAGRSGKLAEVLVFLPPHTQGKTLAVQCNVCSDRTGCKRGKPQKSVVFDLVSKDTKHFLLKHIASPTHLLAEYRAEQDRLGKKIRGAPLIMNEACAMKCPGYAVSMEGDGSKSGKLGRLYPLFRMYCDLYGREPYGARPLILRRALHLRLRGAARPSPPESSTLCGRSLPKPRRSLCDRAAMEQPFRALFRRS